MKNGRRLICALFLCAVIGWGICCTTGGAEETAVYVDHSDNLYRYAEAVARLNSQAGVAPAGTDAAAGGPCAVLCRTDGRELMTAGLNAMCVVAGPKNCYTVYFESEARAREAAESLSQADGVVYAEPDSEVTAAEAAADAVSFESWAAESMNFGAYLPYVDAYGTGSAAIAVIDSGVCAHPLIAGRLLDSGYDYVDADQDATNDLAGHGTAVAGIIADCTRGMAVYIYPVRVLNGSGQGKMSNVVVAVQEAIGKGVEVINLSIESGIMSEALDAAIRDAVSAGITVVAAAGNSAVDTAKICPAHIEDQGVIIVGSAEFTNGTYTRAPYSNYGESVDIYAFGTNILCCQWQSGYFSQTGTSFATPHISAAAALLNLLHPGIAPGEVERHISLASVYSGNVNVPDLVSMIPQSVGFDVQRLEMHVGDVITMPGMAFPSTAMESITYESMNEHIVSADGNILTAKETGWTLMVASCKGFDDILFEIFVMPGECESVSLPSGLIHLEDEALRGASSAEHIILPEAMETIGKNVFDGCSSLKTIVMPASLMAIGENTFSEAVLICRPESLAAEMAAAKGLPYILSAD